MLKRDPNFRRLRVGGRHLTGTARYWLGPDHLLVVELGNYLERYRRFYFRDIQGLVMQRNNQQLWVNLVLGILAVGFLVFAVMAWPQSVNDTAGMVLASVFGLIALGMFAGMLRNTMLGPTCSVHMRTAVQTQKLKSVDRWRAAERLVAELSPLILAGQVAPAEETDRNLPSDAAQVTPATPSDEETPPT